MIKKRDGIIDFTFARVFLGSVIAKSRRRKKNCKKTSHLILQTVIEDLCKYMRLKNEQGERSE